MPPCHHTYLSLCLEHCFQLPYPFQSLVYSYLSFKTSSRCLYKSFTDLYSRTEPLVMGKQMVILFPQYFLRVLHSMRYSLTLFYLFTHSTPEWWNSSLIGKFGMNYLGLPSPNITFIMWDTSWSLGKLD